MEKSNAKKLEEANAKLQAQQNKVSQNLIKAHALYSMGSYQEALQLCESAYEADARRTDNLLLLGAIHFNLKNYSESIFYNQQCVRVEPNFAEAYSNLGNALKELGDVEASIQFYQKAIKLKPRYCDAYNNLASAYMQLGKSQEAMDTYQMTLVINPNLTDAHSNLGNLYKAAGNLEGAKRCYVEAIRIKPDFAIAWSNLAGVFRDQGQLSLAVDYYREAIRLSPEFADAHSNLGNALRDQHMLQDAIACYQTAVRLRPDFAIAHGNLATCLFDQGDIPAAIKTFKYAIQLEPNFPDAHNNLGNALKEDGRLEEAILSYRCALRLKPDHPYAYNNLGNAMKDKGNIKEAIHCYVMAVRLLPTFAAAHSNLASVLKDQGKLSQALSHYQEAITIDPLFADAYSNLGNVFKELGQMDEAMRCYQTAIKLRPNYAEAYSNLAAAYKDSGKPRECIENYRKALSLKPDIPEAFANLVHSQAFICDWRNRDEDFAKLSQLISSQLTQSSSSSSSSSGNSSNATRRNPIMRAGRATFVGEVGREREGPGGGGGGKIIRPHSTSSSSSSNASNSTSNSNSTSDVFSMSTTQIKMEIKRLLSSHPERSISPTSQLLLSDETENESESENPSSSSLEEDDSGRDRLIETLLELRSSSSINPEEMKILGLSSDDHEHDHHQDDHYEDEDQHENDHEHDHDDHESYESFSEDDSISVSSAISTTDSPNSSSPTSRGNKSRNKHSRQNKSKSTHRSSSPNNSRKEKGRRIKTSADTQIVSTNTGAGGSSVASNSAPGSFYVTVPSVQPFHAIIYPLSLSHLQEIARRYAQKAKIGVALIETDFSFEERYQFQNQHQLLTSPSLTSSDSLSSPSTSSSSTSSLSLFTSPHSSSSHSHRLKIGYVSSDFGNHPLTHLMQSVFSYHDPTRFDITLYALSPSDSSVWRTKLETIPTTRFVDLSLMPTEIAAKKIYEDEIDILVNLNGYTKGARNDIFVLHPAPIQVAFLGFCGTMGADYIDYIVADDKVIPPHLRHYYDEKLISLPHSYFVNDHKQSAREILSLPARNLHAYINSIGHYQSTYASSSSLSSTSSSSDASECPYPTRIHYHLPEDQFVFCNFNQVYKIDPPIFKTWMNILKRVPRSVLWILRFPPEAEEHLIREAQLQGVSPSRLIFSEVAPRAEHLARGGLGDVFLDTPLCNAHTTACDILWGGTPIVTLPLEKMSSRVASSLLSAAGLPELIVKDYQEYEDLCVSLAETPSLLQSYRDRLLSTREHVAAFDTERWTFNLEKGLSLAWDRFQKGKGPDYICVKDDEPLNRYSSSFSSSSIE